MTGSYLGVDGSWVVVIWCGFLIVGVGLWIYVLHLLTNYERGAPPVRRAATGGSRPAARTPASAGRPPVSRAQGRHRIPPGPGSPLARYHRRLRWQDRMARWFTNGNAKLR